jgi:general secretion pathway protein A
MDAARHFGMLQRPFEPTLNGRFYFPSSAHAEALARLQLLAEDGSLGFGLLSGEIGCGKTFTAYVFASTLDPRRFSAVFIENANLGFSCILDQVNCTLGDRRPDGAVRTRYQLLMEFRHLLSARVLARRAHLVIVLDEAQELSHEDLAEFRCLTNTWGPGRGALSVVLVGQPELRTNVRNMPAVNTRVGLRYHLGLMECADVAEYVTHRCRSAGHPTGRVFTEEALSCLASASGGMPREINRLAKLSMLYAAGRGMKIIAADEVAAVASDERNEAA